MSSPEKLILSNLLFNEEFSRRTLPYIEEEYFASRDERLVFSEIKNYTLKYRSLPSKEAVKISLDSKDELTQKEIHDTDALINSLQDSTKREEMEWLIDETEKFCKDKALYNAILESIHIIDGKSKTKTNGAIPDILSTALSVSFDQHIGHDYIEDSTERYDFYHQVEQKVSFDLDYMNKITNGGTPPKTLNIVMAGTGVGKSMFMCHHAANCLLQNLNVLYITCEMAEERIAERIDANIMDVTLDNMKDLPYKMYQQKLDAATKGVSGKLIIKEYPTAVANANHFRVLMDELALKKKFKPDIVFIDYLNICASSRMKQGGSVNSYTFIKSIAEELRGLAVERNVPIFSATQVNRTGYSSSDIGLEDTSESFGLPATADFMIALISTDDLEEAKQVLVKQLKNRYNDAASNRKFLLNVDRAKMKFTDVKNENQNLIEANQTDDDVAGNGFDGKRFDEKFQSPKSEMFTDWKM
jgi:replicative DNA helicase|tara:strand:- start:13913 stop:15328 length:1416 start_codon:yes stop_codon:yes gene_type:complete